MSGLPHVVGAVCKTVKIAVFCAKLAESSPLFRMTLTVLADPVQIVQVTAHVVPQPLAPPVQHHAILLAVVVVGLVLAPRRFGDNVTCKLR